MVQKSDLKQQGLQELREFIDGSSDPREQRRALALVMIIEGFSYLKTQKILNVSSSFISQCKTRFATHGIDGLKLGYQGSKGYLTPGEREAIIQHLAAQDYWHLPDVENYIEDQYGVRFKSKQSYYDLLSAAKISWKKTQKKNPRKDEKLVAFRKQEIEKILEDNRADIEAGKLVVYIIDECHRLWGDACGYVWGKTDIRIEIPMTNERERQTYFGALNYQTKQFFVQGYKTANSQHTVTFLKYLKALNPDARLLIIWDGASYHQYGDMKDYLQEVNQDLARSEWPITCELFAPNDPAQNPVEDIWLHAKKFIREHWSLCKKFASVKRLFTFVTHRQYFKFPKTNMYGYFGSLKSELSQAK